MFMELAGKLLTKAKSNQKALQGGLHRAMLLCSPGEALACQAERVGISSPHQQKPDVEMLELPGEGTILLILLAAAHLPS